MLALISDFITRGQHVGTNHADPVFALHFTEIARRRAAGIVDEDVGVWRSREHRAAALLAADVGCDRGHADASLAPEVVGKSVERSFASRIDDEVDALARERGRNRPPQPPRCRANDRRPATNFRDPYGLLSLNCSSPPRLGASGTIPRGLAAEGRNKEVHKAPHLGREMPPGRIKRM